MNQDLPYCLTASLDCCLHLIRVRTLTTQMHKIYESQNLDKISYVRQRFGRGSTQTGGQQHRKTENWNDQSRMRSSRGSSENNPTKVEQSRRDEHWSASRGGNVSDKMFSPYFVDVQNVQEMKRSSRCILARLFYPPRKDRATTSGEQLYRKKKNWETTLQKKARTPTSLAADCGEGNPGEETKDPKCPA